MVPCAQRGQRARSMPVRRRRSVRQSVGCGAVVGGAAPARRRRAWAEYEGSGEERRDRDWRKSAARGGGGQGLIGRVTSTLAPNGGYALARAWIAVGSAEVGEVVVEEREHIIGQFVSATTGTLDTRSACWTA